MLIIGALALGVHIQVPWWTDDYGYCKTVKNLAPGVHRPNGLEPITMTVGDTLVFKYTSHHDVWLHNDEASYDACDQSTAQLLAGVNAGGGCINEQEWNTTCINENEGFHWPPPASQGNHVAPGDYFFSCQISDHCANGQKLKVTVLPMDAPMVPHPMKVAVPLWTDDAGYCKPFPGLDPGNHRPNGMTPMTLLAGQSLWFRYSIHHDVWAHPTRESLEACDYSSAVKLAGRMEGGGCAEDEDLDCIEASAGVEIKPEQDEVYLSCAVHDHCANGQRLVVTVVPISCYHDMGSSSGGLLGFGWPSWADGLLTGNAFTLIFVLLTLGCVTCSYRAVIQIRREVKQGAGHRAKAVPVISNYDDGARA